MSRSIYAITISIVVSPVVYIKLKKKKKKEQCYLSTKSLDTKHHAKYI